jgi:hypothetical protein
MPGGAVETLRARRGWVLVAIGAAAALAYSGFLVYVAFPAEGADDLTAGVSGLEAEGAPYGELLRALDAVSAVLTLVLVPFLWRALPSGPWRAVAVWSTAVFAAAGIPAGLVPLPCGEDAGCPATADGGLQAAAHDALSIISTTALILSAAATALAVRRPGPRWLVRAGWLTVAVQVVTGLVFAAGHLSGADDVSGVAQRAEILGVSAWIVCLAVYAASPGGRERSPAPPAGPGVSAR